MKIGFFDSGVGGLTIFKKALKEINADYIYLADNLNTPYGIKDKELVMKYTSESIGKLIEMGCTIIVVACNTATSVAIDYLREQYKDTLIIGTEPAIKLAAIDKESKKIIVSGTSITVSQTKLISLIESLNITDKVDLIALDKLVTFAESENTDIDEVEKYIKEKLIVYNLEDYSHVVLGCTHFPLYEEVFKKVLPSNIKIVDSSDGIINNLKKKIELIDNSKQEETNIKLIITKSSDLFVENVKKILELTDIEVKVV